MWVVLLCIRFRRVSDVFEYLSVFVGRRGVLSYVEKAEAGVSSVAISERRVGKFVYISTASVVVVMRSL